MDRRGFVTGLAASVAAALSGCGVEPTTTPTPSRFSPLPSPHPTSAHPTPSPSPSPSPSPRPGQFFNAPEGIVKVPVPSGTLSMLPGKGNLVALTVDDGTDPEVLRAYAMLAQRTGLRLTFFANGYMRSWTEHAPLLRPLVDEGQALICNHTWSHADLTRLGDYQIATEIQKNEAFLRNTYGVNGRPFLRPPYGYYNARVDQMVGALGYPAVTMWWGSFGDATSIPSSQVLANARQWLLPQRLVIGHANHLGVLSVMDQIVDIIRTRNLQPVHLADVFDVTKVPAVPPMPTTTERPPTPTHPPSPKPTHTRTPKPSPKPTTSPTVHPSSTPTP